MVFGLQRLCRITQPKYSLSLSNDTRTEMEPRWDKRSSSSTCTCTCNTFVENDGDALEPFWRKQGRKCLQDQRFHPLCPRKQRGVFVLRRGHHLCEGRKRGAGRIHLQKGSGRSERSSRRWEWRKRGKRRPDGRRLAQHPGRTFPGRLQGQCLWRERCRGLGSAGRTAADQVLSGGNRVRRRTPNEERPVRKRRRHPGPAGNGRARNHRGRGVRVR
mmetsp:Transcript_14786/g.41213  ORF Transcript_14786/g.41213 Transcript_14786/m.41213 type:complete len:216 (+) Transcript_14786:263-910(+)